MWILQPAGWYFMITVPQTLFFFVRAEQRNTPRRLFKRSSLRESTGPELDL
jgi:hypothetical protein